MDDAHLSPLSRLCSFAILAPGALAFLLTVGVFLFSDAPLPPSLASLSPLNFQTSPACGVLSATARCQIASIRDTQTRTGTILVVHKGEIIDASTHLTAPASVCVYSIVRPSEDYASHPETPPAEHWRVEGPDELRLGMTSNRNQTMQLRTPMISNLFPIEYESWRMSYEEPHVYTSEVTVDVAATWTVTAETGLIGFDWFKEELGNKYAWNWDSGDHEQLPYPYRNESLLSATFSVAAPASPTAKPPCDGNIGHKTDSTGTWITDVDAAEGHLPADWWGQHFQHNECRLKYYDVPATRECLADKRLHFYGDSNLRRLDKVLFSENKWCSGKQEYCQSVDFMDPTVLDYNVAGLFETDSCQNKPWDMPWGNTTIDFSFCGGLRINRCNVYDELRRVGELRASGTGGTSYETPDVVYFSFNSWELAFQPLRGYKEKLRELHSAINAAHPHAQVLIREATTICCRGGLKGALSMKRNELFNRIMAEEFASDQRVTIIPVSALQGRSYSHGSDAQTGGMAGLWSNHLRTTEIQQEAQMMLNAICGSQ